MKTKMKYFDKYYVGQRAKEDTASGNPLAFAVPDGDDAGARKRKRTVDAWTMGYYSANDHYGKPRDDIKEVGQVYDNLPMTGFRLTEWSGRYITDNKVVRVLDPRGFELEIYIPNLMDIVLNCEIDHGLIKDELVWLREGANNRLVSTTNPEFVAAKKATKEAAKKKTKSKLAHQPGDIISNTWGDWLYIGLMDVEYVIPRGKRVFDDELTGSIGTDQRPKDLGIGFWSLNPKDYVNEVVREYYRIDDNRIEGVHIGRRHVYKEISVDPQRSPYVNTKDALSLRKSQMAALSILSSNNELPDVGEKQYFAVDDDAAMYYDEDGKLHTPVEFTKLDNKISQEHDRQKGNRFYTRNGAEFNKLWKTACVRIQDGKFTTQPIKGRFKEKLIRGTY